MTDSTTELHEFHWLMDMLQTVDVGLVVLDHHYQVRVWNGFMENHSGITASRIHGRNLFEMNPELPETWLRRKVETVFLLNTRTFTTWEQRPYLFRFRNYRPITGTEPCMYQNVTFSPLSGATGSVDYVCLLIYDVTDIASSQRKLEQANVQLEQLSRTDGLTQLLNRSTWEALLANEFERFRRYRNECAVVMFDIDHFKQVNDTYGHQAGDDILREVSRILRDSLRQTDIAGRYGGEEFAIILPETDQEGALEFAERVRAAVAEAQIATEQGQLQCTISLGVAALSEGVRDYLSWLRAADVALYQAKEQGRNQTRLSEPV